ncbi:Phox domain-containing protein [Reticulomyxa filosa]|uniref:Phox domain-containing protein n=1 Tax=Reticulomyxa filosa TaxID=46433 RepID=X6MMN6_RETFI|nr:Phox domain-containing protein [Reticulomyxa filosa]|eukprot:ETO14345.1 Phox domain-containing protein [Reticulomyxa filosa]
MWQSTSSVSATRGRGRGIRRGQIAPRDPVARRGRGTRGIPRSLPRVGLSRQSEEPKPEPTNNDTSSTVEEPTVQETAPVVPQKQSNASVTRGRLLPSSRGRSQNRVEPTASGNRGGGISRGRGQLREVVRGRNRGGGGKSRYQAQNSSFEESKIDSENTVVKEEESQPNVTNDNIENVPNKDIAKEETQKSIVEQPKEEKIFENEKEQSVEQKKAHKNNKSSKNNKNNKKQENNQNSQNNPNN